MLNSAELQRHALASARERKVLHIFARGLQTARAGIEQMHGSEDLVEVNTLNKVYGWHGGGLTQWTHIWWNLGLRVDQYNTN